MDSLPVNNKTAGEPESTYNNTLEAGAAMTQNFAPVKRICAHLNAFHAYAHDPKRDAVEANHYCAHLNDEVRQCILYDSPEKGARIIGIGKSSTSRTAQLTSKPACRIHDLPQALRDTRCRRAKALAFARLRSEIRNANHAATNRRPRGRVGSS
ncbi:hypothetical protein IG631_20670 [Alternaria alternata]|nr:hypothetical protein IG631_20670 [Alternaria alternata]